MTNYCYNRRFILFHLEIAQYIYVHIFNQNLKLYVIVVMIKLYIYNNMYISRCNFQQLFRVINNYARYNYEQFQFVVIRMKVFYFCAM